MRASETRRARGRAAGAAALLACAVALVGWSANGALASALDQGSGSQGRLAAPVASDAAGGEEGAKDSFARFSAPPDDDGASGEGDAAAADGEDGEGGSFGRGRGRIGRRGPGRQGDGGAVVRPVRRGRGRPRPRRGRGCACEEGGGGRGLGDEPVRGRGGHVHCRRGRVLHLGGIGRPAPRAARRAGESVVCDGQETSSDET